MTTTDALEGLTPMRERPMHYDTIIIGAGQAGLVTGYYLKQQGRDFIILDANERVGDSWRKRWDSLRLFTYARYDGLAGMPFPAPANSFPTKDAMANYLEAYTARFNLPVRMGVRVDHLTRQGDRFLVTAGDLRFEADNVVVAMSSYQQPRIPSFAGELDPGIVQFHSSSYRNLAQLHEGGVLLVGAGNSGAEIAMDVARSHKTWLSGRDVGHLPFRIEGTAAKLFGTWLIVRVGFHHLLTVDTPIGRSQREKVSTSVDVLIRTKPKDLAAAGVERVPRTAGARDGLPLLDDGRVLDVANVIWCTGYRTAFSWIDFPVHGKREPLHERGIVATEPGLYFVGLEFLYSASSAMVQGVSRDAKRIARAIAARGSKALAPASVIA